MATQRQHRGGSEERSERGRQVSDRYTRGAKRPTIGRPNRERTIFRTATYQEDEDRRLPEPDGMAAPRAERRTRAGAILIDDVDD
ncbi:hypothetical protein ES703_96164 [subsurface metagenome]